MKKENFKTKSVNTTVGTRDALNDIKYLRVLIGSEAIQFTDTLTEPCMLNALDRIQSFLTRLEKVSLF